MDHKTKITGFETLESAAEEIGNLRYDALRDFLDALSNKIQRDAEADFKRGRKKLARKLMALSVDTAMCAFSAKQIWEICEPHMKNKENG